MNKVYQDIATVYTSQTAAVHLLMRDFGLAPGSVESDIAAILQALDSEKFAARFWQIEPKRRWIGAAINAVSALGTSAMGLIGQSKAIKNDAANRTHEAQLAADQNQLNRDQMYVQQLMQDKELSWNREHDATTSATLVLGEISKQKEAQTKEKMLVIAGAFVLAGFMIFAQKPESPSV